MHVLSRGLKHLQGKLQVWRCSVMYGHVSHVCDLETTRQRAHRGGLGVNRWPRGEQVHGCGVLSCEPRGRKFEPRRHTWLHRASSSSPPKACTKRSYLCLTCTCVILVSYVCHTCAILVPYLCHTCAIYLCHTCTCVIFVSYLCHTCVILVSYLSHLGSDQLPQTL